jgi:hypothetical protein
MEKTTSQIRSRTVRMGTGYISPDWVIQHLKSGRQNIFNNFWTGLLWFYGVWQSLLHIHKLDIPSTKSESARPSRGLLTRTLNQHFILVVCFWQLIETQSSDRFKAIVPLFLSWLNDWSEFFDFGQLIVKFVSFWQVKNYQLNIW